MCKIVTKTCTKLNLFCTLLAIFSTERAYPRPHPQWGADTALVAYSNWLSRTGALGHVSNDGRRLVNAD